MIRTIRTLLFVFATAVIMSTLAVDARAQCTPVLTPTSSDWDCPSINIHDLSHTVSSLWVSGMGTSIYDVDVFTQIQHECCSDLWLTITSPAGTVVVLSANHGVVDSFSSTTWDDSSAHPVSTYVFNAYSPPSDLRPDGALATLQGEDPNGVWKIDCQDQAASNVGVLWCWDLFITTCNPCATGPVSYCTSSTTTNGCTPTMSVSANAASIAAGPGSFILFCSSVEGQKPGLMFYGISGRNNHPWAMGSSSLLCVNTPTQRMRGQNSGGTPGACDGSMSEDFFDFTINHNPGALGDPLTAGTVYDAQAWFRDPAAPKTTNLSNGLEFVLCP